MTQCWDRNSVHRPHPCSSFQAPSQTPGKRTGSSVIEPQPGIIPEWPWAKAHRAKGVWGERTEKRGDWGIGPAPDKTWKYNGQIYMCVMYMYMRGIHHVGSHL